MLHLINIESRVHWPAHKRLLTTLQDGDTVVITGANSTAVEQFVSTTLNRQQLINWYRLSEPALSETNNTTTHHHIPIIDNRQLMQLCEQTQSIVTWF